MGKTTLINTLIGRPEYKTKPVSETGKGKHTTVRRQLIMLENSAMLIDTPGMREFEIRHEPDEGGLAYLFAEMRPYIGQCRFGLDCDHWHEPDCAIKAATEAGEIAQMRYDSYIHTLHHMPGKRRQRK